MCLLGLVMVLLMGVWIVQGWYGVTYLNLDLSLKYVLPNLEVKTCIFPSYAWWLDKLMCPCSSLSWLSEPLGQCAGVNPTLGCDE